jgi:AcrR family transcriptional regulator
MKKPTTKSRAVSHPYEAVDSAATMTRTSILNAAAQLFYRSGTRTVSVDDVAAAASVTKVTVYKHFGSKDALVAACLDMLDDRFFVWFVEQVENCTGGPRAQLLAVFDIYDRWFQRPDFRGCFFINSTVELADPEHPGHQAIRRHKERGRALFRALAAAAGLADPTELSDQWVLLTEGATITALVEDDKKAAKRARRAAERLLSSVP